MAHFPQYQDAVANIQKGQLPFYILINTLNCNSPLHHHDFAEFSFVFEGRGTEIINGKKHAMQPGTASFLLPHHIHEIYSDPGTPIRLYCCMFDINILFGSPVDAELCGMLLRTGNDLPSYVDFPPQQAERVRRILDEIRSEYLGDAFGKNSLIRGKLMEALLLYIRAHRGAPPAGRGGIYADGKKDIWDIVQYVHLHYTDKLTLENVSRQFKVSVPYISRAFREHVGQSFLDYLHGLRIRSAASLLISTDMAISDIASEVGFESFRTFSRVFKELKRVTPSEYRQAAVKK